MKSSYFKKLLHDNALAIVCLLLLYFPLIHQIGTPVIRLYDESRLAKNVTEMLASGNFLVVTFDGKPDLWNTKPPLLLWLQSFCVWLFGRHEWAFRLPTIVAAFGTCLALWQVGARLLGQKWIGAVSVMILVTMPGYLYHHAARNGDYDALLTCCTTWAGICWWQYATGSGRKYFYRSLIWLIAGALTKSVAALLFLPVMGMALLLHFRLRSVDVWHWLGGAALFIGIVGGYYLGREWAAEGYLLAVFQNDLGGRFGSALEGHQAEVSYYFKTLWTSDMGYWAWGIGLIPFGWYMSNAPERKFLVYVFGMPLFFGLVISVAQTKLMWYDVPMFPWLAIAVAVGLSGSIAFARRFSRVFVWGIVCSGCMLLLASYIAVVTQVSPPRELEQDGIYYDLAYFLRSCQEGKYAPDGLRVIYSTYRPNIDWYMEALQKAGADIRYIGFHELQTGMKVVTCLPDETNKMTAQAYKLLYKNGLVHVFEI